MVLFEHFDLVDRIIGLISKKLDAAFYSKVDEVADSQRINEEDAFLSEGVNFESKSPSFLVAKAGASLGDRR